MDDCFSGVADNAGTTDNGNNGGSGVSSSNQVKHIKMVLNNGGAEDNVAEGAAKEQVMSNEESDYEDMMTPTDDEGGTSLNHTQKIPISLIKAKDKASVSV